jgi:hypothetical protein
MKNDVTAYPLEIRMLLLLGVVCAAAAAAPYAGLGPTVVLLASLVSGTVASLIESALRLSHVSLLDAYRTSMGRRRRWITIVVGANVVFFSTGVVALVLWSRLMLRVVAS